jgi:hypothetical protein
MRRETVGRGHRKPTRLLGWFIAALVLVIFLVWIDA